MREIKFRCFFYDGQDYASGNIISLNEAIAENYIEWDGNELMPTDQCTILMQYTGLKDKNGKEIYEGDVLESNSHDTKGEVKWEQQACQFWIRFTTGRYNELTATFGGEDYRADYFEIIGNIYENPELVNQKQETY